MTRGSWKTIGAVVIAIDTNIIVRALTADDPEQAERVRTMLAREQVFVSTTVLLEAEWVLRKMYSLDARRIPDAIEAFTSLPQVHLEHPERVVLALERVRQGIDFADALHQAAAAEAGCDAFVTFDRALVKRGAALPAPARLI